VPLRLGTIDHRQLDAGERLRRALEKSLPTFPVAAQSEVHTAPFWRDNVAAGQVKAVTTVRLSAEAVGMVVAGTALGLPRWVHLRLRGIRALRKGVGIGAAMRRTGQAR
jgi:hypothetical protein